MGYCRLSIEGNLDLVEKISVFSVLFYEQNLASDLDHLRVPLMKDTVTLFSLT